MTTPKQDLSPDDYQRRFGGVGRLYGDDTWQTLQQSHVMIVGVGGVGSWAAEALARTAVGQITLVDMDILVASNVNRQLPALTDTFGETKCAVMAQRINQINPLAKVTIWDDFVTQQNVNQVLNFKPDAVFDCTDDLAAKIALIKLCKWHKIGLLVAGAAGGKTDPTQITVDDLLKTQYDPLLARLRYELRKNHNMGKGKKMGIRCVYSKEPVAKPQVCITGGLQCGGYGSATVVTAGFAFAGVAEIVKLLQKQKQNVN